MQGFGSILTAEALLRLNVGFDNYYFSIWMGMIPEYLLSRRAKDASGSDADEIFRPTEDQQEQGDV